MSGKSGCNSSEQECKKGPERCCCSGAGNLFSRLLCLLLHLLLRFRILHFFDLVPKGLSEFLNHLLWIVDLLAGGSQRITGESGRDRKSTRLNSSHVAISYAVFCLKQKKRKHRSKH